MNFPISLQAASDAALVIPATVWLRKMFPKLDGWLVVLVVALLALVAGGVHAGDVDAGAPGHGPTMAWMRAAGMHSVLVFAAAFGGWNALRKLIERAVETGRPPSIPPVAVLLLFVLAPTLHGCGAGGLSPKDAASLGLDVTDAVCDQLDEKLQDEPDWMKFSCQAVDTATQLKHVFMAKVKRENAAEFAMRHKANPCTEDAEVAP